MKETTLEAMPPCFDKWCQRFDDLLKTKAQKAMRVPLLRERTPRQGSSGII